MNSRSDEKILKSSKANVENIVKPGSDTTIIIISILLLLIEFAASFNMQCLQGINVLYLFNKLY